MATRKTKKKQTKIKKTAAQGKPAKKSAKKRPSKAQTPAKNKKLTKKKPAAKSNSLKKKNKRKAAPVVKKLASRQAKGKDQSARIESFTSEEVRARSAGQSGGLQGLSNSAGADSESVGELIEEGNSFEAGVVSGVEAADGADEQEVRTHEVPEDDVPGEYLDED